MSTMEMRVGAGSGWTDDAVARLVGQTPVFTNEDGIKLPGLVTRAWKADGFVLIALAIPDDTP